MDRKPQFSRQSVNPEATRLAFKDIVAEIKAKGFKAFDYNWQQEVEIRKQPNYRHPIGMPYGESALLENREFERYTAESVIGKEVWDDATEMFFVEGFGTVTHDKEFDLMARRRMIIGSRWLLPLLEENLRNKESGHVLELGPFTNPLVVPRDHPGLEVTYLDNEEKILANLKHRFSEAHTLKGSFSEFGDIEGLQSKKFDYMVMSQIFNYVDFRKLLIEAKDKLEPGGLVFINNVAHYGIPEYFAPEGKRPNSEWETLQVLKDLGFEIKEWVIVPTNDSIRQKQPLDRLLVVVKNN